MAVPKPTLAQKLYWKVFSKFARSPLTKKQYDALSALKCRIAYNKYGGYCVPESSRHRPAAKRTLSGDIHEPKTIEFLSAHYTGGDIVHAGTYFGDFLPALSAICKPESKIWAFEPNLENFNCAQITLILNAIENVELFHAGLGERTSSSKVVTTDRKGRARGGASRIAAEMDPQPSGRTEIVDLVTVDDVFPPERHVAVIQLDIEGSEQAALAGALKTVRRCLPVIILENLSDGERFMAGDWFAEHILNLGYQMTDTVHNNSVFRHTGKSSIP